MTKMTLDVICPSCHKETQITQTATWSAPFGACEHCGQLMFAVYNWQDGQVLAFAFVQDQTSSEDMP